MNTNETIYETYARAICPKCNNRNNDRDLCDIRKTQDNTARCVNYSRCMQNKCNTCIDNKNCWNGITAKKHKPIMKGINR